MLALKILDIKDFMNKLLIGNVFDHFWLNEASITTFNTFHIDGTLHPDFYNTDMVEILTRESRNYSLWSDIKPYAYSIIKGKSTPLSFKIILQLPSTQTAHIFKNANTDLSIENVKGLYLNIQYKNNTLLCTTGVSFAAFLPDKRPEQLWDQILLSFFKKHLIPFEEL